MSKKIREILEANIRFISLCPLGKNGFATLYKAESGMAHFEGLSKAADDFDEKGELLAVVWAPGVPDSDGDFASPEAVETMAHSYMKNAAKVDLIHDCEELPKDAAYITESFIVQKTDERFQNWPSYDGEAVDVTGGWAVKMKINAPELRKAYRDGEWNGVSMYGPAKVKTDAKKAEAIEAVTVKKNKRLLSAVESWFEKNGELDSVELSVFRGFEKKDLMIRLVQHLTTDMEFGAEPALVMAAKIADNTLNQQETEMTKEEHDALVAKAIEEAVAPLNEKIETLTAAKAAEEEIVADDATNDTADDGENTEETEAKKAEDKAIADAEAELAKEEADAAAEEANAAAAEQSDEDLLKAAADAEIVALRKATDFADAASVRDFVAKRREINAKLAEDLGEETVSKSDKKKPRRNIAAKTGTETANEETVSKARTAGKNLAEYINRQNGAK